MKVLFFWPGPDGISTIGSYLLGGILRSAGHDVRYFSGSGHFDYPESSRGSLHVSTEYRDAAPDPGRFAAGLRSCSEALAETVREYQPDVVALSALSSNWLIGISVLELVEKNFFLFVGGVHTTFCPDEVISHPLVDAICIGDGEETVLRFSERWDDGGSISRDFSGVPNLWYKDTSGARHKNAETSYIDLNGDSYCDDFSDFPVTNFDFVGRRYHAVAIETTRGCPMDCSFCSNKDQLRILSGLRNPSVRRMDPEVAVNRIKHIARVTGADAIRFIDQEFLAGPVGWFERFGELYKKEIDLPFTLSATANSLTEDRVRHVKHAGCVNINFGVESGNEEYRRDVLNKKANDVNCIRALELANKYEIRMNINFMIGMPGQTKAIFEDTIRMIRRLGAPTSICFFIPLPGNKLYDQLVSTKRFSGFKSVYESYWAYGNPIYVPDGLTREDLIAYRRTMLLKSFAPRILHPVIKICERPSPWSDRLLDAFDRAFAF